VICPYVRIPSAITFKVTSDWGNVTQHTLTDIDILTDIYRLRGWKFKYLVSIKIYHNYHHEILEERT